MNNIERAIEKFSYLGNGAPIHNVLSGMERKEKREMFLLAADALEKQLKNGWIPVSERLPAIKDGSLEYNELCLVTVNTEMRTYTYIAYYSSCNGFMGLFGGDWNNYVTAWQPLPEEYKEATSE
jgi:hypothetical protein